MLRTKILAVVLVVALLSVVAGSVFAQRRTSPKQDVPLPAAATAPIDPESKQLPRQYRGADPEALINELERRGKESKGEFETTQAFNARMAKLEAEPLIGTISKGALIPFTLASENTMLDKVTSRYDADNSVLAVSIEMAAPVIGVRMDPDKRSVPLRHDFEPSTSYVGQMLTAQKSQFKRPSPTSTSC